MKGWRPTDQHNEKLFRKHVVTAYFPGGVPEAGFVSGLTLKGLQQGVVDTASSIDFTTTASAKNGLHARPPELRQVESDLRLASSVQEKRVLRRQAQRVRRRWKAKQALSSLGREGKIRSAPVALRCNGRLTSDRDEWSEELYRHCQDKYTDSCVGAELVTQWRSELDEYAAWPGAGGNQRTAWDLHVTMAARSQMAVGKAGGGGDGLVVDVFKLLPWSVVLAFHVAFLTRFCAY